MIVYMFFSSLTGLLAATYLPVVYAVVLCLILVFLWLFNYRCVTAEQRSLWFISLCCFTFMLANSQIRQYFLDHDINLLQRQSDKIVYIEGVIQKASQNQYTFKICKLQTADRKIFLSAATSFWLYGKRLETSDKISLKALVELKKFGKKERIILKKIELVRVRKSSINWLYKFRENLTATINDYLSPFYANFFVGLLLGDDTIQVDPALKTVFRDLGLLHLLVVSGAQVAILSGMMLTVFNLLHLNRWLKFFMLLVVNGFFMLITGGDVSIFRAVLMLQINLFLTFQDRQKSSTDILLMTALIMLVLNPGNLYNLGFILSFGATFSLLELNPRLAKLMTERLSVPTFVAEQLSMNISPLLITTPFIMLIFHRFDFLALAANLFLGFFISYIVITGFVALMLTLCLPLAATIVFKFVLGLMVLVKSGAQLLYQVPGHTLRFANIYAVNILAYYTCLFMCMYNSEYLQKRLYFVFIPVIVVNVYFMV
ncbi:MAG: ComEC/Rec2 family competence protein [Candidatus Margulisbacteria bacterium]|nr:ComEC/Rec2 family competence protein [Candidatus Margulisiibacteriota bacterium]